MRLHRLQSSVAWTKESATEDELTFVLVKAGVGTYVQRDSTYRLVAGTVLFFCGRMGGRIETGPKGDCVFATFSVPLDRIYPIFSNNEIALLDTVLANFRAVKIYPANSVVALESKALAEVTESPSVLVERSQLIRIVAVILADEFKAVQGQRGGQNWAEDHMIRVFEKLSSAELLNLSVDDLAAKFNCSRRHLNRLFHQHFNLSITALRMEIRLLKAVSLLRNPTAKVINVAEQCGFNHLGLFNTCFKRRFGVSPGQWRKNAALEREAKVGTGVPGRNEASSVRLLSAQSESMATLVTSLADPALRESGGVPLLSKGPPADPGAQVRHNG